MGILNVTPDSFSDGGRYTGEAAILAQVEEMAAAGADIIDIGGESTRPGAKAVSSEEELDRVLPAVVIARRCTSLPISVDTAKAGVARRALDAGATLINDVSALRFDRRMAQVVRDSGAPVVLMHMQGTPGTMQNSPCYTDVVGEIRDFFRERIRWAVGQGIPREKIIIDPGIGFGKTLTHNLILFRRLPELTELGCPLLLGHSRKRFIGDMLGIPVEQRDPATALLSLYAALHGAAIVRVHNVAATMEGLRLLAAIGAAEASFCPPL